MKKSMVTLKVLLRYNLNLTQKQATIFNVWVFQNRGIVAINKKFY